MDAGFQAIPLRRIGQRISVPIGDEEDVLGPLTEGRDLSGDQAYLALQHAQGDLMEEAGGSLSDIVKMTTFLTHAGYIETYRAVRNELFSDPMPPNTLVICESLASPDFLMEVEAMAVLE